ncbi:MAG: hypothetical protein WD058_08880, partial [Dehalococcoidia bacterium]
MNQRVHASRPAPSTKARRRPAPAPASPSRKALRASDVLALQASAGNRAARSVAGAQRTMNVG